MMYWKAWLLNIIIAILFLAGLIFIPILIRESSLDFIRNTHNYWLLLNATFISAGLGFTGDVVFVIFVLTNKNLRRYLDRISL